MNSRLDTKWAAHESMLLAHSVSLRRVLHEKMKSDWANKDGISLFSVLLSSRSRAVQNKGVRRGIIGFILFSELWNDIYYEPKDVYTSSDSDDNDVARRHDGDKKVERIESNMTAITYFYAILGKDILLIGGNTSA